MFENALAQFWEHGDRCGWSGGDLRCTLFFCCSQVFWPGLFGNTVFNVVCSHLGATVRSRSSAAGMRCKSGLVRMHACQPYRRPPPTHTHTHTHTHHHYHHHQNPASMPTPYPACRLEKCASLLSRKDLPAVKRRYQQLEVRGGHATARVARLLHPAS